MKTNFAIAVISHCPTQSKRSKVIAALKKYVPVHVYGHCGDSDIDLTKRDCFRSCNHTCMREIFRQYKYYLAFENSLCKDYITEKLYKVLDLPIIPVVYGGANYSDHLPANSYINVLDFQRAKQLSIFLTTVASSADKYLSYFKWRRDYQVVESTKVCKKKTPWLDVDPQAFCNLCEFLHKSDNTKKVIKNIKALWGVQSNCFHPNSRFWK